MINLDARYLKEITALLRQYFPDCEVRVFGSRVQGKARQFSDLDIAIVGAGPLQESQLDALKQSFAESDLPISVDVLDWHGISEDFQQVIAENYQVL